MKKLILILLAAAGLVSTADADSSFPDALMIASTQTNYPVKTAYEQFARVPGAVLVGGWSRVGTLSDGVSFPVDVKVVRLTNMETSNHVYAIVLITSYPNYAQYDYIDSDELDGFIHGTQLVSRIAHPISSTDDSAASYITKGGFLIMKFSSGGNAVAQLKSARNQERNTLEASSLDKLTDLLNTAKANIQGLIQNGG